MNLACGDLTCTDTDNDWEIEIEERFMFPSIYSEGVVEEGARLLELVVILGSGCVEIC